MNVLKNVKHSWDIENGDVFNEFETRTKRCRFCDKEIGVDIFECPMCGAIQ